MRIFRLRGITIVMADEGITHDRIKVAKESILAKFADENNGKVEGDTITTDQDIEGPAMCYDELGCAGEFVEVRNVT